MMNSSTVGGWGLKSSVDDLARWDGNFHANKLPAGKHLEEFLKQGTLLGNRNVLDVQPVERHRGLRRMQFTGGMPGFGAAMVRFPDERLSVVVLTNDNWRIVPWELAEQVAEIYLGDRMEKPPAKTSEAAPPDAKFVSLTDEPTTGIKPAITSCRAARFGSFRPRREGWPLRTTCERRIAGGPSIRGGFARSKGR